MTIERGLFRAVYTELLEELFDGVRPDRNYTYVVQGREGVFLAFEELTAKQASYRVNGCSSVAAHLDHARYYIWLGNEHASGNEVDGDWEGSWKFQEVDEEGWRRIKEGLMEERTRFMKLFGDPALDLGNEEILRGALANLIHAAFHLGAVRSLARAALAAG